MASHGGVHHIDGLVQERCHSSVLAMELRLSCSNPSICWLVCQKQVSRTGTSNHIAQILWDVITCPCPWYLQLARKSLYHVGVNHITSESITYSNFHLIWQEKGLILKWHNQEIKKTRTTRTPAFWGYPPRRLMITHTIESYWIPSQKKTKSKLQI